MGLEVLSNYESFEYHSVVPRLMCRLQNYIIQDGFLIFYTGKNPCLSVCLASFPLDEITVSIEIVDDCIDCLHIYSKDNQTKQKIYAHKC